MKCLKAHSIKYFIIGITTLFTLVITLVISIVCLFSFQTLLKKSLETSTTSNLQLIMNSFSTNMSPIMTLSKWCGSNTLIAKYLSSDSDNHKESSLNAWTRLKEEFYNNRSYSYINRIIVGNFDSRYIQTSRINSYNGQHVYKNVLSLPYFDTLYKAPTFQWIGLVPDLFSDDKDALTIPILRPIYDASTPIGWSYISVSIDLLADSIDNYIIPEDSKLYLTINSKTYQLMNGKFYEITEPFKIKNSITHKNAIVETITDEEGKISTAVTVGSFLDGWYLTQTLSNKEFDMQNKNYILLVVLIGITILTLGICLTFYLNRIINKPIQKINNKIKLISTGDFSRDTSIEWNNEIGTIGKGINTLSEDIVNLINARIANEKEKQELEYQMLQSQINPHFIYNTLNSIKWMATIQNATGIAEMTTALSRLMRSISKENFQIISIREELALLDNYFIIQKYRYGGTLSLEYQIEDEELYNCGILKFTLQPIVENSIFHGIEPKGAVGKVTIQIKRVEEHKLRIEITDNGIGMTEEQMNQILEGPTNHKSNLFKKIGVNNVMQRIHYTFGKDYGLSVSSKLGEYTTISILIPYITVDKLEHERI